MDKYNGNENKTMKILFEFLKQSYETVVRKYAQICYIAMCLFYN